MKKKLTLSIEKSVKDRAKKFARQNNTSISDMVEKYLDAISNEEIGFVAEPGSWTESMIGIASLPGKYKKKSSKKIKEEELLKKYG